MVSVSPKQHTICRPCARFEGKVPDIKNRWVANKLYKVFSHTADLQIEKFNLSLNDWASKICIFLALDIPQSYIAFKKNTHKWETTSRNVIVTITGLCFTIFTKADKYSLNGFLNLFMRPQYKPGEFPKGAKGFFARFINPFRPKVDYYKIFDYLGEPLSDKPKAKAPGLLTKFKQKIYDALGIKAQSKGAKKAHWASLDSNYLEEIEKLGQKLEKTATTDLEKELKTIIPVFLRRYKLFSFLATVFVSAFTIYLIGELALKAAFKFFAPLDHDWTPSGDLNKDKSPENSGAQMSPKSRHHKIPATLVPYLPYVKTIERYPPLLTSTMAARAQFSVPTPFLYAGTQRSMTASNPNPFLYYPPARLGGLR